MSKYFTRIAIMANMTTTKKEIAELLGIDRKTLDNWQKNRPFLYQIVSEYFSRQEEKKEGEKGEVSADVMQKEICYQLKISRATLHNWRRTKPYLYGFIMEHFDKKRGRLEWEDEVVGLFERLTPKEQEMYLSEIRARVLRRELDDRE